MVIIRRSLLVVGIWCCLVSTAWPAAKRYSVASGSTRFTSKATTETVVGRSGSLRGWFQLDPSRVAGAQASFTVSLKTLRTGNKMRDKQMHTKFLETHKFPQVTFALSQFLGAPAALPLGKTTRLRAQGTFTLHGVKRTIRVPVRVTPSADGRSLKFRANFSIRLADYKIKRPKFLALRLAETIHLSVRASMQ